MIKDVVNLLDKVGWNRDEIKKIYGVDKIDNDKRMNLKVINNFRKLNLAPSKELAYILGITKVVYKNNKMIIIDKKDKDVSKKIIECLNKIGIEVKPKNRIYIYSKGFVMFIQSLGNERLIKYLKKDEYLYELLRGLCDMRLSIINGENSKKIMITSTNKDYIDLITILFDRFNIKYSKSGRQLKSSKILYLIYIRKESWKGILELVTSERIKKRIKEIL